MNIDRFSDKFPGKLEQITTNFGDDWAFIPNPLPPNWEFPIDLWPLLSDARQSLARLDGIGRTLPNPELLLHPLQHREALTSSSLEGTYASPQQLLLFEANPREPKSSRDPANASREVLNYSDVLKQGASLLDSLPFCLRYIRELHKTLLMGVRGNDKRPGDFRPYQVHIGSDRRFIPPPASKINECLAAFEEQLNSCCNKYDPLVMCYLLHYQFEAIHPFVDGNGRMGRALLSLMIYKWCNLKMPWLYMSAFFERYKSEYIDRLFAVSTDGDWHGWIEFCLRGTKEQANDAVERCDKLRALRDSFHSTTEANGPSPRTHAIIDSLFNFPMVTVRKIQDQFEISYPTARADLDKLRELGILDTINVRPVMYYSIPIFEIAYNNSVD